MRMPYRWRIHVARKWKRLSLTIVSLTLIVAAAVNCVGIDPVSPKILITNDSSFTAVTSDPVMECP